MTPMKPTLCEAAMHTDKPAGFATSFQVVWQIAGHIISAVTTVGVLCVLFCLAEVAASEEPTATASPATAAGLLSLDKVTASAAEAFSQLQQAIKDRSIERLVDLYCPRQGGFDCAEILAHTKERAAKDPVAFWREASFGGFLPDARLRNVDILKHRRGDLTNEIFYARIFAEGTGSAWPGQQTKPAPRLALLQAVLWQNRWTFVFVGGDAVYYCSAARPDFSSPAAAFRSIRNAQSMLDGFTLYEALASTVKTCIASERYRQFVAAKKDTLVMVNNVGSDNEPEAGISVEELSPLDGHRCVRVKHGDEGFVQEPSGWRWVPKERSSWVPDASVAFDVLPTKIAAYSNASISRPWTNSLGMRFVRVPGTDVMFCIWETRVKDYAAYAKANADLDKSWQQPIFENVPITPDENCPVVNVSWHDAKAFCEWLTRKERADGRITCDVCYRLPTDAEWSVAVRLGPEKGKTPSEKNSKVKNVYPWGNQWPPPANAGNYGNPLRKNRCGFRPGEPSPDGFTATAPVGSFKPNQFGLCDLGGNVWEWCDDASTPSGEFLTMRGASWIEEGPEELLSSTRHDHRPDTRLGTIGFRCVLAGDGRSP